MSLLTANIQDLLAVAAAKGQRNLRLRLNYLLYTQLLEEYAVGHPELPVEPLRQLSTDFGLVDVVVDDRTWMRVEPSDTFA